MKMMMYEQLYRLAVQKSACEVYCTDQTQVQAFIQQSSSPALTVNITLCACYKFNNLIQLNKNMYTNIVDIID